MGHKINYMNNDKNNTLAVMLNIIHVMIKLGFKKTNLNSNLSIGLAAQGVACLS